MAKIGTKKFLSPLQLRKRFGLNKIDYTLFLEQGLPTYTCAGVTRHPIDEVYFWCEQNRVELQDQTEICTKSEIKNILGIGEPTLVSWEKAGMPRFIDRSNPRFPCFKYNKKDVIAWLKSQQSTLEVR